MTPDGPISMSGVSASWQKVEGATQRHQPVAQPLLAVPPEPRADDQS